MQAAACYTVYDRSDRVVYHGQTAPVDMSRPIHESLPARFPGGHMIFDTAADCPEISVVPRAVAHRSLSSPLLTDQRTAQAMHLPHRVLPGGVALVQPGGAAMVPGLTVIPSETVAARRPSRETVITELRDPPATVVQSVNRSPAEQATRAMGAGPSPSR